MRSLGYELVDSDRVLSTLRDCFFQVGIFNKILDGKVHAYIFATRADIICVIANINASPNISDSRQFFKV